MHYVDGRRKVLTTKLSTRAIVMPNMIAALMGVSVGSHVYVSISGDSKKDQSSCVLLISPFDPRPLSRLSFETDNQKLIAPINAVLSELGMDILSFETVSIEGARLLQAVVLFSPCSEDASASKEPTEEHLTLVRERCQQVLLEKSCEPTRSNNITVNNLNVPVSFKAMRLQIERVAEVVAFRAKTPESLVIQLPAEIQSYIKSGSNDGDLACFWDGDSDTKQFRALLTDRFLEPKIEIKKGRGNLTAILNALKTKFSVQRHVRKGKQEDYDEWHFELLRTATFRDALHREAALHQLLTVKDVRHIEIASGPLNADAPRIFVSYDYSRRDLAELIHTELKNAVVVTGHCDPKSGDWRPYFKQQISSCQGLIGVIPSRDEGGRSDNLVWEFEETQNSVIPNQWFISEDIRASLRPFGSTVIRFSNGDASERIG